MIYFTKSSHHIHQLFSSRCSNLMDPKIEKLVKSSIIFAGGVAIGIAAIGSVTLLSPYIISAMVITSIMLAIYGAAMAMSSFSNFPSRVDESVPKSNHGISRIDSPILPVPKRFIKGEKPLIKPLSLSKVDKSINPALQQVQPREEEDFRSISSMECLAKLLVEDDWEMIKKEAKADPTNPNYYYIKDPDDSTRFFVFYLNAKTNQIIRWHVVGFAWKGVYNTTEKPSKNQLNRNEIFFEQSCWGKIVDYSSEKIDIPTGIELNHPAYKLYVTKCREIIKKSWSNSKINSEFENSLDRFNEQMAFLLNPFVTEIAFKYAQKCVSKGYEHIVEKCCERDSFIHSLEAREAFLTAIAKKQLKLAFRFIEKGILSNCAVPRYFNRNPSLTILEAAQHCFYLDLDFTKDFPLHMKFMKTLLKAGGDPDYIVKEKNILMCVQRYAMEIIYGHREYLYSQRAKLISILLYHKASIPKVLLDSFKQDLRNGELSLAKSLFDNGHITENEYNSYLSPRHLCGETWTLESLKNYLFRAKENIEYVRKRSNLAWDRVDFAQVADWKQLKKEAKRFIETTSTESQKNSSESQRILKSAYEEFQKEYEALVKRHPLLRLLRKVSREIRTHLKGLEKTKKISPRLCKMISLWSDFSHKKIDPAKILLEPHLFKGIYRRVSAAAQRYFQDPLWYACTDLWVHGTKNPTLVMMQKTEERKLWSTGNLLKQGIAPLCGELCGSHRGINESQLSGEIPDSTFEEDENRYMGAGTRLLVSVLYASNTQHYKEMIFNPEESWKQIQSVIDGEEEYLSHLTINILRLRLTDPEATIEAKLKPIYNWLKIKNSPDHLEALTRPLPLCLNAEDLEKMENPYPILFGCPDQSQQLENKRGGEGSEYLNQDGLQLGKEIQMAFTTPSHVETLKQALAGEGVAVEEMDMAFLLETMEMMKGSTMDLKSIEYTDLASAQFQISTILQRDLLPYYAALLPKEPVYLDSNGKRQKVEAPYYGKQAPTYEKYREGVLQEGQLARDIHGPMHAVRVTFFNVMQMALFGEGSNPILSAVAAGAHDIMRQDEGKDLYEGKSAGFLRTYLKRYKLSDEEIEIYVRAVQDKDPKNGEFVDNVQRMVHNADCWEILRLCHFKDFRFSELHFEGLDLKPEYVKALSREIKAFIDQTEDQDIKRNLEWESENMYLDLMRLFLKTHQEKQCYPLMHKLLEEPLRGLNQC